MTSRTEIVSAGVKFLPRRHEGTKKSQDWSNPDDHISDRMKLKRDLDLSLAPFLFLRVFVLKFPVCQVALGPTHTGGDFSVTAEWPLHIFSQAAVGDLSGVDLQSVRQPRNFG